MDWRRIAIVIAATAALNSVLWLAARLLDVSLVVSPPSAGEPQQVPLAAVVFATVVPMSMSMVMFALLRRVLRQRATPVFVALAVVVTLLSMTPIVVDEVIDTASRIWLAPMHLLTGAAAIHLAVTMHDDRVAAT